MTIELTIMCLDTDTPQPATRSLFEKDRVLIGRSEKADLKLEGAEVSSRHAMLHIEENGKGPVIFATDLGSTNGTMIDSDPLEVSVATAIDEGRRLRIGHYLIRCRVFGEAKPLDLLASGDADDHEEIEEIVSIEDLCDVPEVEELEQVGKSSKKRRLSFFSRKSEDSESDSDAVPAEQTKDEDLVKEKGEQLESQLELNIREESVGVDLSEPKQAAKAGEPIPVIQKISTNETSNTNEGAQVTEEIAPEEPQVKEKIKVRDEPETELKSKVKKEVGNTDKDFDDIVTLDFRARKLFTISGRVERQGGGVAQVDVSADGLGTTQTDKEGRFSFTGIPQETEYSISFSKAGYQFLSEVKGVVSKDIDHTVSTKRLLHLKGRIVHDGTPLAGVEVDGGAIGSVVTDEQGNYSFQDVPEDAEYKIAPKLDGYVFETLN